MKKRVFRIATLFFLVTLCAIVSLLVAPSSSQAATLKPSSAVKPLALGCLIPNLVLLQDQSITVTDVLDAQKHFTVRVRLFGTYNNDGDYCGKMKAQALVFEPAHTFDGTLTVRLLQGDLQLLNSDVLTTPGGGLDGLTSSVSTTREKTVVGRASVTYVNQDGTVGSIETPSIIG